MKKHESPETPRLSRRGFMRTTAAGASGIVLAGASSDVLASGPAWQQTSEKKIRMGVVGGGFGVSFHWHEHPNCIV